MSILALLAFGAAGRIVRAQTHAPAAPRADTVPAHVAALAGRVRDFYGHPLTAAVVKTEASAAVAIVDDSGAFLFRGLPPGTQHFAAMRIGYAPVRFDAILSPDSTLFVAIRLEQVTALPATKTMAKLTGRSALLDGTGFYDRQADQAMGYFMSPEEIASKGWAFYPAQYLLDVPQLLIRKRQKGPGYTVAFPAVAGISGAGGTCVPNVFIDGVYTNMQVDDAMIGAEIYAIEIYVNATAVPTRFQAAIADTPCGALVIWTKRYAP